MRSWLFFAFFIVGFLAALFYGGLFVPLWVSMTAPLDGFTFTDAEDFGPTALIVLTLAGLAARHLRRPYPERWTKATTVLAFVFAILPPLVVLAALYAQSWRAEQLIGDWPQVMINDPKWIGKNDNLYQSLRSVADYLFSYAGWGVFAWLGLMLHLRRQMEQRTRYLCLTAFLFAWAILTWEPGQRFWWWMD